MPVCADPNKTTPVWLDSDASIPLESRPVFLARFLTRRQVSQHRELIDRAIELKKGDEAWKCVFDAIAIGVVGWRNQKRPDGSDPGDFSIDKLDEVLTDNEIEELATNYPAQVRLAERDLKNFESPSPSGAAASAKPAESPAPTDPATASQTPAAA